MADERRAASLAPVISAFADDYIETCKQIADPLPGGRLDPPCGLFLDEVANIVPLPQLPALMSFAGGTGIFLVAVLQSMAQARNRWGRDAAEMLWGAATVKIILGGLAGRTSARSPSSPASTASCSPAPSAAAPITACRPPCRTARQ